MCAPGTVSWRSARAPASTRPCSRTWPGRAAESQTIDVLQELTPRARRHLAAAGDITVQVIIGDGARGHEPGAPYDRVIATTAAWDILPDSTGQAAPDARLVIPLRIAVFFTREVTLTRRPVARRAPCTSVHSHPSGFIKLRGPKPPRRARRAHRVRRPVRTARRRRRPGRPGRPGPVRPDSRRCTAGPAATPPTRPCLTWRSGWPASWPHPAHQPPSRPRPRPCHWAGRQPRCPQPHR